MEVNLENKKGFKAVIIEIRAGTGGEEAALFANDLFRMYSNYASSQGWKKKVLDTNFTSLHGIKQVVFELEGNNAWEQLKNEGGVHRVQRIPKTEKGGRVHTSTVTVAVLPKPEKTEVKIKPEELKIDVYRASGPGGQNVNKRETAIRIIHLPTGLMVTSQTERNQLENKENALSILAARLLEKNSQQAQMKMSGERNIQIGSAERAEKIRTYNFPQDRITDHRIKKSWHNLEKILDGRLEPIVKAFRKKLNQ
jgi:peptide chain release factor 1